MITQFYRGTQYDADEEYCEKLKNCIQQYKISYEGINIRGAPLLQIEKINLSLLYEIIAVVRAYFTHSGQKGLDVELIRVRTLEALIERQITLGYIFLAFTVEGYGIGKENPRIRCRYLDLNKFEELRTHINNLSEWMLHYSVDGGSSS